MTLSHANRPTAARRAASARQARKIGRLRCAACLALVGILLPANGFSIGEDRDEVFLAGLRARRQFLLAAIYCERELTLAQDDASRQARLTVELIRVLAEQALHAAAEDRDVIWQRCSEAGSRFVNQRPGDPRAILVRTQSALAELSRGEQRRMEAEVSAASEQPLQQARALLRVVSRKLEVIHAELSDRISARPQPAPAGEIDAAKLRALRQQIQQQLARAARNSALCYTAGTSDRTAALLRALRHLESALRELSVEDPFAKGLLLDQAVCQRLMGDFAGAEATLDTLEGRTAVGVTDESLEAERLRLLIAQEQYAELRERLLKTPAHDSADWRFALLESQIALWRVAATEGNQPTADRWRDRATASTELLEQLHGAYWARRANLALIRAGRKRDSGSLSILARTAADLYRRGQLAQAIAAYDKAAGVAAELEQSDAAFEMAFKAAMTAQQQQSHLAASERFRDLAMRRKEDPRASQAHLMAVVNMAEMVRSGDLPLSRYEALLVEHRRLWPSAATALRAALWQGQLLQQRHEWGKAIDTLQSVIRSTTETNATSPDALAAAQALAQCWLVWLQRVPEETLQEKVQQALTQLDDIVQESPEPGDWPPSIRVIARLAARLRIYYRVDDAPIAEQRLRELLASDRHRDDTDTFANELLLALAMGLQPKHADASREQLNQQAFAEAAHVRSATEAIRALARQYRTTTGASRAKLAPLLSQLAARLLRESDRLSEAKQLEIRWIAAQARKASDRAAARVALAQLAEKHPSHMGIQEDYGELLLSSNDPAELASGLQQWRRIANQREPRTTGWFRAKYSIALAMHRLGDNSSAKKLIQYLKLTEDLGAAGFADQFDLLLERCEP